MNFNFAILTEPYNREHWKDLIRALFPNETDLFGNPTKFELDSDRIASFVQFGNIELRDRYNTKLALFEVQLEPNTTKLHINRVALRKIVDEMRKNTAITGAFAVFADAETGKWRFTFIAKAEVFGEATVETADPKRYTYLFGKDENIRTARERFTQLANIQSKRLEDIIEAFSVEKINREFFDQYKRLYEECWGFLSKPDSIAYPVFKINPQLADDKARKPLRDFAKRLMGRLVFLYFLQKKGWVGCPANIDGWSGGDHNFVANLFYSLDTDGKDHFYSQLLTRLFFSTLNERRINDLFDMPDGSNVKIPYLNGGLFDGDVPGTEKFDLPSEWFGRLFEFFGKYNFTIDESAPNDQEIGIDPEMLGHIFENLLEENREKGAYYTPKEIVHYMCQESLLLYLKERVGLHTSTQNTYEDVVWSDSRAADEAELENFVRNKKRGEKHNFIYNNAHLLEKLLKEVRICDPAIGSGAFPMGLLYEIFHCQIELDLTEHPGELKKDIIHHCIYGVDKDKGAVDIARLRFWLSLVVDEDAPQPLPNLDYKIMQGDSLLESFEGIDLSNLMGENRDGQTKNGKKNGDNQQQQHELFAVVAEPTVEFGAKDKAKLSKWINQFFEPQNSAEKADLQVKINNLIDTELNDVIRKYKMSLFSELGNLKSTLAREQELKRFGTKYQKEITRLEAEILACEAKQERLVWWQEREEKPFFLWRTWFRDVFDREGFDIVIGNPPYVQLQRLGHYSDTLQTVGFETFARTGDLYCLFYEKAIKMLRPGGVMAFITSNSWLKTLYGEPLRRYFVQNSTPVALLNFEDAQLFKSAIVETNILLSYKGRYDIPTRSLVVDEKVDTTTNLYELLNEKGMVLRELTAKEWIIGDVAAMRLKDQMEEGNKRLGNINVFINFGVKTGFNKAFIVDNEEELKDLFSDSSSLQVVVKTLRGRDLQRYSYVFRNQWLIFTKRGIAIDNFPAVKNHLLKYYDYIRPKNNNEITGRKPGPYKWYEIQDNVAYFHEFSKPKIIWGELSDSPKFSFDDQGYYPEATLFFMTGEKLKFLLAILNSKAGEWYFNQISTTSGMGTNRWKKYKIEQLPIPSASVAQEGILERLVEYLLWLNDPQKPAIHHLASNTEIARYFDDALNMAVYELYFEEELKAQNLDVLAFMDEQNIPVLSGEEEADKVTVLTVFEWLFKMGNPVRTRAQAANLVCEPVRVMNSISK